MRRLAASACACAAAGLWLSAAALGGPALDRAAERWVRETLRRLTLDEKIGQLLVPSLNSSFTSVDSEEFERLRHLVHDLHIGGIHVFGGGESVANLILSPAYGSSGLARKGDPYVAAALLNRLQRESKVPLLATADFEGGVGYILDGGTRLPRAMALAAAGDPDLAYQAGRLSAGEGRALGVHVDFYPVVDVNNNPRNPIINIRSFGEDPRRVGELAQAYIRGIHDGGMLATAKHFPGHGDTSTDTHLALPTLDFARERLDRIELPPFRAAIAAGVDAVMSSHIALPALDPTTLPGGSRTGVPATLSRPILTGLLRGELDFDGLIFTDSMSMYAISRNLPPDRAAAMAVAAGADCVLHSPDNDLAFQGIKAAVERGEIAVAQIERSVERLLRAKARLGLHRRRETDLAAIDVDVGGRTRGELADRLASRAITLVRDDRQLVPLTVPRTARLLYLSVIDYGTGWREGAPSRTFLPELRRRWPEVTAVEISDRTTAEEFDLVRALARHVDAVVASIFVRIASYSGRMDLSPAQIALLDWLAAQPQPLVTVVFGNPYIVSALPRLPAVLLTYEFYDGAERAAVRALAGETPVGGRLPISIPGLFEAGHGLTRAALAPPTAPQ
ncbi:MAG TPA: glycoside hydrolase family 3 N-terminal domain-containing protein [Vicinamibacterales bacterium]|nr:glycoside hydrolase family 3 N-terminal domain-containing protein [Vicinamibacterales bacterium]